MGKYTIHGEESLPTGRFSTGYRLVHRSFNRFLREIHHARRIVKERTKKGVEQPKKRQRNLENTTNSLRFFFWGGGGGGTGCPALDGYRGRDISHRNGCFFQVEAS